MALYNLPLGIRIPSDNEYPKDYDVRTINEQRNSANITQGFRLKDILEEKYSCYSEVNVDADKIWDLFSSLSKKLFSDIAYGIINFKEEKPILSGFTKLERIMKIFEKYKFELVNDGFLEFGIAYYDEESLNEIFISSFKYLRIWSTKKELLIQTLNNFGIQQIENIGFIDEFPVVSEALTDDKIKGTTHYSVVLDYIRKEFEKIQGIM